MRSRLFLHPFNVIGKNVVIGKIDPEGVPAYVERGYFFKAKREYIQKNRLRFFFPKYMNVQFSPFCFSWIIILSFCVQDFFYITKSDFFAAAAYNNFNRRSVEAKSASQAVLDIPLIRKMEQLRLVAKDNERWRIS